MTRLTLDPQTGLLVRRPKGWLETSRPSTHLILGDAPASSSRTRTTPTNAGPWVSRSTVAPSGRVVRWREREIRPGEVERVYADPPLSQRGPTRDDA